MSEWPVLSLPEWTVLAVVNERPTHGFAIAQLTAPQGELGRIWHIPRPVVTGRSGGCLTPGCWSPVRWNPGAARSGPSTR